MSDNVEFVREAAEANNSEDLGALDDEARNARAISFWDPACEYTSVIAALEPATYRGHDGIRRWIADLADRWAQWSTEVEEIFDLGPDTVFVTFRFHAVGKDSGVPIDQRLSSVFVLSDGKLVRGRTYSNRDEALEAAGLGN